jgi:hypothetical protein
MSSRRSALLTLPLIVGLPLLVGACGAPVAVAVVSYGADGISLVETGKSTTDHLVSMTSRKDCALWRVLRSEKVCREREGDKDPYDVDYDSVERQPSEDGVAYTPPLSAGTGAPPTAWTPEAYKSVGPTTGASQPTAEPATVAPATALPSSAPAKPSASKWKRKAKSHAAVRKASPGQVASVP